MSWLKRIKQKDVYQNEAGSAPNNPNPNQTAYQAGHQAPRHQQTDYWNEDIDMQPEITKSTQITTFQPTDFENIDEIANHLIKYKQIKLNLTSMNVEDRLRTIDFISGVMYAYHGKVEVIGHHQYLFIL